MKRNEPLALLDLQSVDILSYGKLVLNFKNNKYKEYSKSLTLSFFTDEDSEYVQRGFEMCVDNKDSFESVDIVMKKKLLSKK